MEMSTTDIIQTAAIAITLLLTFEALRLYTRTLQATIFGQSTVALNLHTVGRPEGLGKAELTAWYVPLINSFEYFTFYANHGHLSQEIVNFHKDFVIAHCDYMQKNHEKMDTIYCIGESYSELSRFYEKHTGEKLVLKCVKTV